MEQIFNEFQYLGTAAHDQAAQRIGDFLRHYPSILYSDQIRPYILEGLEAPSLKVQAFTLSIILDYLPELSSEALLSPLIPILFHKIDSELAEIATKSADLIYQIAQYLQATDRHSIFNEDNFILLSKIASFNLIKKKPSFSTLSFNFLPSLM